MSMWPNPANIANMIAGAFKSAWSTEAVEFGIAKVGLDMAEAAVVNIVVPMTAQVPIIGGPVSVFGVRALSAMLGRGLLDASNSATGSNH